MEYMKSSEMIELKNSLIEAGYSKKNLSDKEIKKIKDGISIYGDIDNTEVYELKKTIDKKNIKHIIILKNKKGMTEMEKLTNDLMNNMLSEK